MERPTPARVAGLVTVALLSALVVTQTLERAGGLVVVIAAAATTAVLRQLGWAA